MIVCATSYTHTSYLSLFLSFSFPVLGILLSQSGCFSYRMQNPNKTKYNKGYIFPLMCAGSAFGRLLYFIVPVNADDGIATVPFQLCVLCTAAAINVAITRTALATTLILTFLSGEHMTGPAILMASICSLFATSYMVRFSLLSKSVLRVLFCCY